ncbi:MAG: DUF1385 domain-containing protein [Bryobacterales bacterium]|nr:DUF1385 domain-containing protein [Bryobacterales bacterium]
MLIRTFLRLTAHMQMMPVLESAEETLVGGQAVVEGVMMRAPHSYCVAVRKPDGEIVSEEMPIRRPSEKWPAFRYPILRGLGSLGQAMSLGVRALRFSANAAVPPAGPGEKPVEISSWMLTLNVIFSLAFFIFLYKFVPLWAVTALGKYYPSLNGHFVFNLADGLLRLGIFLVFLFLISRWSEIRRVFEYHGAEHKVVFNFESGLPVSVENARTFPTFHPRCGTSFLLVVMVISMAVYTAIPFDGFVARFAWRLLLLPVIAGLSYELIRFAARRQGSSLALISAPGLWLQRITTQPPSDDQTAVAICALNRAMNLEVAQGGKAMIA